MRRSIRAGITSAAAAAMLGLGLAACSSGTSTPVGQSPPAAASTAPAAQPAVNPVPILKLAGADVPASVKVGSHDAFGNRMAEAEIGPQGWNQVTVYTASGAAAYQALLASGNARPDDYTAVITIPGQHAVVTVAAWIDQNSAPHWAPGATPAQIAQRVGGHLLGAK